MMKHLLVSILSPLLIFFSVTTAFSQEVLYDAFDNAFLNFDRTEGSNDVYEVFDYETSREKEPSTPSNVSFKREVIVRNNYVATGAAIEDFGPLMEQGWVLSTGSSTLERDAYWRHHVSVVYVADKPLENLSVSLRYLNTRLRSGSLEIALSQIDENGRALWYNSRIVAGHADWNGDGDDRSWRDVTLTAETTADLARNRPINRVHIRELDITDEPGTGFLDDIRLYAQIVGDGCDPVSVLDALIEERGLTLDATGAIHAEPNRIKPHGGWNTGHPMKKRVLLHGYLVDKLSALIHGGDGISSAYIRVGDEKIILRDNDVDLIAGDGRFNVTTYVERRRGTVYPVELFATDGDGKTSLVDQTSIHVMGKPPLYEGWLHRSWKGVRDRK